ncbi:MAG: DMT family transporter [Pseudonocardia sp.]|nr:DMT family transporter [Pseudonocardia sp.]
MTGLATGLALLAAVLFAVASVVQQRSAAAVPADVAGAALMRVLLRRPLWWLGTLSDAGGYVAQAAALAVGSLLLVQPLLVTTLLVALPLGARWAGRRLRAAEWGWALLLAGSLAVFVAVGEPTAGLDRASPERWLPTAAALGVLLAGGLVGAAARRGTARAVLLAAAAGVLYGANAALTKGVVSLLDDGVLALVTTWETYALVGVAVGGIILQQSAFQAGDLDASLPAVAIGEPVFGVVIGLLVLGEQLRADGGEWVLIGLLAAAMVVATMALARSAGRSGQPVGPVPAG